MSEGSETNESWKLVKGPGHQFKSLENFMVAFQSILKSEEEAMKEKIRMLSMMGLLGEETDDHSK